MTLHINTITPTHIISVSDRQISTSRGMLELADDQYKHLLLMTDDGTAVISFAGFAGTINTDGQFERSTIDWLTELCVETSRSGKHTIDGHLTDIRDQAKQYIDESRKKGIKPEMLRLAIVVLGLCNNQQFTCVIDNCLEKYWLWSKKARETFTTRICNHSEKENFRDGYITQVLGDERLGLKQRALLKLLGICARNNNPRKIFETSVRIIRAAAFVSNGRIGTNCSGVRMTTNESGIEVYDDRKTDVWEVVMPNSVTSRTSISAMVADMRGKKSNPKPPVILKKLHSPKEAMTLVEKLAFWYRAIEKLRLLHNQQGSLLGKKPSKPRLEKFHRWQDDNFHPFQAAVFEQIHKIQEALRAEAPVKYNNEYFSNIKNEQLVSTLWDKAIDLSDLELYSPES